MSAATIKINNFLLSRILKIVSEINSEVILHFSNNIEIKTMNPSFSNFLTVVLSKGAYSDYKKNEDFEILINFEILQQVSERSERSKIQEISLNFSDAQMRFFEEGPNGSVFDLNIYSSTSSKIITPKFHTLNEVKSDSTLILEGLKKLSIISKFFDIINDDGKVILHSKEAVYGEGAIDIGTAKNFSSEKDYYHISPLKEILEIVPDKTAITLEIADHHALKISFIFSHVAFGMIMAASKP
ncbi:MAG: hypothetical protein ABSB80_07390 [Methanoregula sp.]|jgi:hypothetical protein|uniref:hypothetical protein n=1 Tax=Methanoregula sp. TaxID=2052170 RepID=UPI003D145906